ncbi:MAG: hypothetical protein JXA04_11390 [Gammaproteobacteria bacterium]|nr:hypothetical protein [Gammaproteobacteria bacterium]
MDNIVIEYRFTLDNGQLAEFKLQFHADSMELIADDQPTLPEWTALEFHQCPHCPLSESDSPQCPVAVGLLPVVKDFDRILSYEELQVEAIINKRSIQQHTSAQKALSSMIGLIMATSGCPYTTFFRTMARHHLPFAGPEETVCRATAYYLLGQFLLMKAGQAAEFSFSGLDKIYKDMQKVNVAIAQRLRATIKADSTVNAIVLLDYFAQTLPMAIEESLEEIRYIYKPYFDQLE